MKKWIALGVLALLVAAAGVGVWRWRAAMAPVTRTGYAKELHEHILAAQFERWPGASDQWDDLAWELRNIRAAREAMGSDAGVLRGFDISGPGDPDARARAVGAARAAGVYESAGRIAGFMVAARPYDKLRPEDLLVGVLWDERPEAMFLQRAEMARAFIAAYQDPPGASERLAALGESLALAGLLSWQGDTLAYLNARSIATEAMRAERALLVIAPAHEDAWLASLDDRIQRFQERFAPATHVIAGDRIITLDSLHRMHTVGGSLDRGHRGAWDGTMAAIGFDPTRYRGPLADSLAWLNRFVAAANASARARGGQILGADAALASLHAAFIDLGDGPGERWPALMITLPEYAEPIAQERHTRIAAAGTRVMVAIERYRLAQGQLPESLAELGGLLPSGLNVDPVTAQPWDYQQTADGYTLASRALPGYEADEETDTDPLAGVRIVVPQAPDGGAPGGVGPR